jgi:hypothetical protein
MPQAKKAHILDEVRAQLAEAHREPFDILVRLAGDVPQVKRLAAHSYDDALLICLIVDSNDEKVWDTVADIEYSVQRHAGDAVLIFKECDLRNRSLNDFAEELPIEASEQLAAWGA